MNEKEYKILKCNEETNVCIIVDKYLNYGLADKDLNIILPCEYMKISFCPDNNSDFLLQKKSDAGIPKYGIANKNGQIIIEPKCESVRYSKQQNKYELKIGGESFLFNDGAEIKNSETKPTQQDSNVTDNEYYNAGIKHLYAKDYKKAYKCFVNACDLEPNNEYYQLLKLQCRYEFYNIHDNIEKQEIDNFVEECSAFLENTTGRYDSSVYFWRGFAYNVLSEYKNSIKDLEKSLEIEQNADVYILLGQTYFNESRYNKAIECFDKTIEIELNSYKAYQERGFAKYYFNIPIEDSIKDSGKSYKINNNYELAIMDVILYFILLKDYNKALQCCDKVKDTVDFANALSIYKSLIHYYLGDKEVALNYLKNGFAGYETIVEDFNNRMQTLRNCADLTEDNAIINEKIEQETSVLQTLQYLKEELNKTIKICTFCGKIESDDIIIMEKNGKYMCNECLELCNEILEEEGASTEYITLCHSENAKGDYTCGFCGRTNEECEKIIAASDDVYICNGCVGVFNNAFKNKTSFDVEYQNAMNALSKDHSSFYKTDKKADSKYLKDKSLQVYGKELAYKYIVRAAHVLKKHNCQKEDRQKIIKFLSKCSEFYVNAAIHTEFPFGKPEMDRLLTVGMEVAFQRIVVMYKNNILNNISAANDLIDTFAGMVCATEMVYIKDKDDLKNTFYIANSIYINELKNDLKEWVEKRMITKEQFNKAFDNSSLVYLQPEINKLMKMKSLKFSRTWYMIAFILVWVIFKLIIIYTKHHGF